MLTHNKMTTVCPGPHQFTNKNTVNLYYDNPNTGAVAHIQPGVCKGCFLPFDNPPTKYDMFIECPWQDNDRKGTGTFIGPATDLYVPSREIWGKWSIDDGATRNLGAWFGNGVSDWGKADPKHLLVSCLQPNIDDQDKSLEVKYTEIAIDASDATKFCLNNQIFQNCNNDQLFKLCQGNNRKFVGVCDVQQKCQRNTDVIVYDDLPVHTCTGEEEGTKCYISDNKNSTCQKTSVGGDGMRCGPAETCIGEAIGTRCWRDVNHSEESTCDKLAWGGSRCGSDIVIKPEVFLNSDIKPGVGDLPIKAIGAGTAEICFTYCINEETCDAAVWKVSDGRVVQPDNCWLKGIPGKDTDQLPLSSTEGFTTLCIPGKCKPAI